MQADLTGQVAIVTGSGRGLGRAIAQALAGAGAAVTVTSRSAEHVAETTALIEAAGGRALSLPADVTDQQALEHLVAVTERELGPVTLLVNNAAMATFGPFWEIDAEEWWQTVETNLRGTFLATRAVLPGMIARRGGRIINLSGGGAFFPLPGLSGYACSKAAVLRLTDTLAAETAEYGIQVFVLGPGAVPATEMGERAFAFWDAMVEAGKYGFTAERRPLPTPPERAAEYCVVLASGVADALSGRHISVTQDVAELAARAEEIRQQDLYVLRLRI